MGTLTLHLLLLATSTTTSTTATTMGTAGICVLLVCMVVATSAEPMPKYRMLLQKTQPKLGCSIAEMLECVTEIEQAVADCSHLATQEEIMTCVSDIVEGTPNCLKCICDVVPALCA